MKRRYDKKIIFDEGTKPFEDYLHIADALQQLFARMTDGIKVTIWVAEGEGRAPSWPAYLRDVLLKTRLRKWRAVYLTLEIDDEKLKGGLEH